MELVPVTFLTGDVTAAAIASASTSNTQVRGETGMVRVWSALSKDASDGRNAAGYMAQSEGPMANERDKRARDAVTTLRDFARTHGMDHRQRDPLVMAIHDALDELSEENARLKAALAEAQQEKWFRECQQMWDAIIPLGPRCRDCADADGTCPNDGMPCDPTDAVIERVKHLRAQLAEAERAREEAQDESARLRAQMIESGKRLQLEGVRLQNGTLTPEAFKALFEGGKSPAEINAAALRGERGTDVDK